MGNCRGAGSSFHITVLPTPTATQPSPVTVCGGAPVSVTFSGSPGATFSWENSNPAIGLPASGTGNLNFSSAPVAQQEVAVITVTPLFTFGGTSCPGDPVSFPITVNHVPLTDDPPDVSVCAGEPVSVTFSGTGSNATYNWTNSNPAIGLGASGTGNISFNSANVASLQTAVITVTSTENGCTGPPQTFNVSIKPRPVVNNQADRTLCAGATLAVNFSGTPGAVFSWTNSNPAIGLGTSGSGNFNFTAAPVLQTETAVITVTPELDGCTGPSKTFIINVNPLPVMQQPDDLATCGGEQVDINFSGAPGNTYAWTNSNPFIGLGLSGNGSVIVFTTTEAPNLQTATVTVTPGALGCVAVPLAFDITVYATPQANPLPDLTVCAKKTVSVNIAGTPGTTFNWTNSNPDIGLAANGSGNIAFTAADIAITQTATITVTPVSVATGCAGPPKTFVLTVEKCCATDAGTLDTAALFACGSKTLSVNYLGNQNLEPNDTLRFILYANPANPMGSILQYSDSLKFPFLPGITEFDVTYYTAVIAGNQLPNDSVDTTDPCFSFAKGGKIIWRKIPAITVGSPPESVCRDGCVDVLFEFTGSPPFDFNWLIEQNGQILLLKSDTSDTFQKIITVCPSDFNIPGSHGDLHFRVNFLQDKFCGCGD